MAAPTLSAGDAFWLVASSTAEQAREQMYSLLRSRVERTKLVTDAALFDVPLNLKAGSFDDLIRLTDDLNKADADTEQVVRRLERQALEIDPNAELRIMYQRTSMTVEQYLRRFTWDDSKYPRNRHLRDNVNLIKEAVHRLDEEIRIKAAAYNEVKQSHTSLTKKEGTGLAQRDLIDVLTPEKVSSSDFVETEHLTTVVVAIPNGVEEAWLKHYESLDPYVVPRSTRKFDVRDRDGTTLWKVTLFKSSLDKFKNEARQKRFIVREFEYNPEAMRAKLAEKTRIEAEKDRQEAFMARICLASFSDCFIAWCHIKAVRVFVEATLRFGVPTNFAAFLLRLLTFMQPAHGKEKKLRKELEDVLTTKGMFGKALIESNDATKQASSGQDSAAVAALNAEFGGEEYYPYVSFTFTPFTMFTQK